MQSHKLDRIRSRQYQNVSISFISVYDSVASDLVNPVKTRLSESDAEEEEPTNYNAWNRALWLAYSLASASDSNRDVGCFPLCQRFRKFRLEFKWKGPFWFLPTVIFGISSGGGPLILVGIFRPKFAVPFLTNQFFALIREFGKGTKSGKSHSYWLARIYRKMPFHFPRVFLLISNRSVWHKHP